MNLPKSVLSEALFAESKFARRREFFLRTWLTTHTTIRMILKKVHFVLRSFWQAISSRLSVQLRAKPLLWARQPIPSRTGSMTNNFLLQSRRARSCSFDTMAKLLRTAAIRCARLSDLTIPAYWRRCAVGACHSLATRLFWFLTLEPVSHYCTILSYSISSFSCAETTSFILHVSDAIKSSGNGPWCLKFLQKKNISVFWSPVSSLSGHDVTTTQLGKENCCTRLWFGTFCGNNCCPKTASNLLMGMKVGSLTLNASEVSAYEPLRKKEFVREFRQGMSKVESCLLKTTDSFVWIYKIGEHSEPTNPRVLALQKMLLLTITILSSLNLTTILKGKIG